MYRHIITEPQQEYIRKYIWDKIGMPYPIYRKWIKKMCEEYNLYNNNKYDMRYVDVDNNGILYVIYARSRVNIYDCKKKEFLLHTNEYYSELEYGYNLLLHKLNSINNILTQYSYDTIDINDILKYGDAVIHKDIYE